MPSDDRRAARPEGLNRPTEAMPDDRSAARPEGLNRPAEGMPDDRRAAGPEGLNQPAEATPDDRGGASRDGLGARVIRPWRRTGNRTVLRDRWIHLRAEAWETPQGVSLDPWWMLDWADWVHVVALTPGDELVLVRQFRAGAQATTLELPGGIMEPGETPLAAAQREFTEETGFAAAEWRAVIGLPPEPAHCANRIHFVLALGCTPARPQALDAGEEIAVELHPLPTLLAGLGQGVMQNAMHVGGLLLGLQAAGRLVFRAP